MTAIPDEEFCFYVEQLMLQRKEWLDDGCPRDLTAWLEKRGLVITEEALVKPDVVVCPTGV